MILAMDKAFVATPLFGRNNIHAHPLTMLHEASPLVHNAQNKSCPGFGLQTYDVPQ
jgi:hypothetical protein